MAILIYILAGAAMGGILGDAGLTARSLHFIGYLLLKVISDLALASFTTKRTLRKLNNKEM